MSDHNVKLAGHFQNLVGQCPMTDCYFQHCDPCMTSEHSTTARWNRLGVDFAEGGKPEYPEKNPRSQVESD